MVTPLNLDLPVRLQGYVTDPKLVGYQLLTNYEVIYWQCLVGRDAWALYLLLRSYCHQNNPDCNPSIRTLMDVLGLTDRRQLIGREDNTPKRKRTLPGMLDVLQEHQLVVSELIGEGPERRYIFHLQLTPSLLTPDQLACLPASLQKKHAQLVARVAENGRKLEELNAPSLANVKKTLTKKQPTATPTVEFAPAAALESAPEIGPETVSTSENGGGWYSTTPPLVQYHPPPGTVPPKQHPLNNTHLTKKKTEIKDNNNSSGDDAHQDVVVVLAGQGITGKIAHRLAGHYSRERIFEKIDFLAFLLEHNAEKIKNPHGWLRKAIEEDYSTPDGYKTSAQRAAEVAAANARQAEQRRMDSQVGADFQAEQARQAAAKAEKRALEVARLEQLYAQYGTTAEEQALWPRVLAELELRISPAVLKEYFADSALFKLHEGQATIGIKQYAARDWVMNRLGGKIQRVLGQQSGVPSTGLTFVSFELAHAEQT